MRLSVIAKVDRPTDWVSNLGTVEKDNGKLRVCLDPSDLKRHHYQLPTVEDTIAQTAGAKYFLCLSTGYWQLLLDEQSSKLLTFHTPFGHYAFERK